MSDEGVDVGNPEGTQLVILCFVLLEPLAVLSAAQLGEELIEPVSYTHLRIRLLSNAKEENYQVKNIEKQLDAIRGNIRTSLSKQYDNCSTLVRELRSRINSTQGSLGSLPKQERKVLDLTREQRLKQHLYVFLMNKREETSMMITNAVSKGVIVDEAFVPSDPVSMGKKTILAAGILAGLIIPFMLIYALKIIKGRPESRSEMESRLSLPVLGEVPTLSLIHI